MLHFAENAPTQSKLCI